MSQRDKHAKNTNSRKDITMADILIVHCRRSIPRTALGEWTRIPLTHPRFDYPRKYFQPFFAPPTSLRVCKRSGGRNNGKSTAIFNSVSDHLHLVGQPTLPVFEAKKENAKIDKFLFLRLSFTSSGTKLYLKANSATAARVSLT